MRTFIQHRITKENLTDISQGKLKISDKLLNQLSFSQYADCLLKILIPGITSEIYSIINNRYLKISEIEKNFFQSFCEDEIIYMELIMGFISGEPSYRLNFSKLNNFADLMIDNPPQVSKEVISTLCATLIKYRNRC